jgi:sodium-dependent dicarboxylate transporter 2/3/5
MKTKEIIGIVAAATIILGSFFFSGIGSLSHTAIITIATLISFLIMLVTEALPLVVTCLIFVGLMPVIGVSPSFGDALKGYSHPILYFLIASFGIAGAFIATPLSKRILLGLLKVFSRNVKSMLFAVMMCSALVSSLISNVPTCAVFMAIGLSFLELYEDPESKKRTGRAFMIGIPVASMIGGMMTPVGSSINLLAISLLEEHTGLSITFVQWMLAGIPLAVVMMPIAWWLITRIYKPAEINATMVKDFATTLNVPPKMDSREKKVIVLMLVMLALWILSSWFRQINVMVVALLGCTTLFLPGMNILEIKRFMRENSWTSFFMMGTVLSIASAMISNGVSDWIVSMTPTLTISTPMLVAFVAAAVFVLLVVIPVAPSLVAIIAYPVITLASGAVVSPAIAIVTTSLCACNCYLLPLDAVPLITYGKGYYGMTDMAKSTLPLQLITIVLVALWLPLAFNLVGL